MVDANELQRMARLIDMNRERLSEIENQISRIETVQLEHEDTIKSLTALSTGSKGHLPIGAGVMIPTPKSNTTLIDLGAGIFGEKSFEESIKLVEDRLNDLNKLKVQFTEETHQLNSRIEELAKEFDNSVNTYSENNPLQEKPEKEPSKPPSKTQRRRRGLNNELTLDD